MPETPAPSDSAPAPPDLPLPPLPLPLPLFWPVAMVAGMEQAKADLALRNLEFVQEEIKLHGGLKAKVASPNVVRLDLRTMVLRDYGRPGGIPCDVGRDGRRAGFDAAMIGLDDRLGGDRLARWIVEIKHNVVMKRSLLPFRARA